MDTKSISDVLREYNDKVEEVKGSLPDIMMPDTHLKSNERWGVYTFYDIPREIELMKLLFDFQMFLFHYGNTVIEKHKAGIYNFNSDDLYIDFMHFRQFNEKVLEPAFQEYKKKNGFGNIRHRRAFKNRGNFATKEEAKEMAAKLGKENEYETNWIMQNGYVSEFNPTPGDDYEVVDEDLNSLLYESYREVERLREYEQKVRNITLNYLLNVEGVKIKSTREGRKGEEVDIDYDELKNKEFDASKYKFYSHEDTDKKIIHCRENEDKYNEEKRRLVENIEHYNRIIDERVYSVDKEKFIKASIQNYKFKVEDAFLNDTNKIEIFKLINDIMEKAENEILEKSKGGETPDVYSIIKEACRDKKDHPELDKVMKIMMITDFKF